MTQRFVILINSHSHTENNLNNQNLSNYLQVSCIQCQQILKLKNEMDEYDKIFNSNKSIFHPFEPTSLKIFYSSIIIVEDKYVETTNWNLTISDQSNKFKNLNFSQALDYLFEKVPESSILEIFCLFLGKNIFSDYFPILKSKSAFVRPLLNLVFNEEFNLESKELSELDLNLNIVLKRINFFDQIFDPQIAWNGSIELKDFNLDEMEYESLPIYLTRIGPFSETLTNLMEIRPKKEFSKNEFNLVDFKNYNQYVINYSQFKSKTNLFFKEWMQECPEMILMVELIFKTKNNNNYHPIENELEKEERFIICLENNFILFNFKSLTNFSINLNTNPITYKDLREIHNSVSDKIQELPFFTSFQEFYDQISILGSIQIKNSIQKFSLKKEELSHNEHQYTFKELSKLILNFNEEQFFELEFFLNEQLKKIVSNRFLDSGSLEFNQDDNKFNESQQSIEVFDNSLSLSQLSDYENDQIKISKINEIKNLRLIKNNIIDQLKIDSCEESKNKTPIKQSCLDIKLSKKSPNLNTPFYSSLENFRKTLSPFKESSPVSSQKKYKNELLSSSESDKNKRIKTETSKKIHSKSQNLLTNKNYKPLEETPYKTTSLKISNKNQLWEICCLEIVKDIPKTDPHFKKIATNIFKVSKIGLCLKYDWNKYIPLSEMKKKVNEQFALLLKDI